MLWHCANNKHYNCIKTVHKITPYKLFNTKFDIGLNASLTRAQPFDVNVGVGRWGYSQQLSFFHSTLRERKNLTCDKGKICSE